MKLLPVLASVCILLTCRLVAAQNITVAQDGTAQFKSVQEAIMSVPAGTAQNPVVIHIRPGIYKELIYIQHEKRFFRLVGEDANKTVLTFDLNANLIGKDNKPITTFRTPSTVIDADDFMAENITFENSAGPVGQALAIRVDGDRAVFRNCRFLGWQDTLFLNRGRQYFEDCYIQGHVDFIFGAATAFFERCHIHCLRNGYIAAASTYDYYPYGFVFSNCKITGEPDVKTYLGRPWRDFANTIYLDTEMSDVVRPEGWQNWNLPAREKTARYAEFNSKGPGANPKARVAWSKQLNRAQAKKITVREVLGGSDKWDPRSVHIIAEPKSQTGDQDVLITNSWQDAAAKLAAGGKVLLSPRNSDLNWISPPLDTVPVYWNRQMGPAWGRMLGLWINRPLGEFKSHTLDGFPTDQYFDWQWGQLMPGTRAVNLDRLPEALDPVVWAIDDLNRNYKLGIIFECAVGNGRLLVSTIDVTRTSDSNPVLSQLRNALFYYVRSDCFQPNIPITPAQFRSLFFDTRIMSKLHATASVGGEPAGQVIDGDPNTYLLVGDQKAPAREQVEVVITFPTAVEMSGLVVMPRQNHREHEGDIRDYSVMVSDDGTLWSDIARGEFPSSFEPHRVQFQRPIKTRYLKLVSLTGFGTDRTTSLSEIAIVYAGPKLNDKGQPIEYQRNRTATSEIDEGPDKPKAPPKPKP